MTDNIQYRYAFDEVEQTIDITRLTEADRKDYSCIGCGNVVRPVFGKVKKSHFRHLVEVECSGETYLHKMAKRILRQSYEDRLVNNKPVDIELERETKCTACKHGPCKTGKESFTYDLTKHFREIYEEQRDGQFVPDLLLRSLGGHKKIYVEVAVTHSCSEEKLASEIPIIEFFVCDEDDLEILKTWPFNLTRAYNFSTSLSPGDYHKNCNKHFTVFVVYTNGSSFSGALSAYKVEQLEKKKDVYVKQVPDSDPETYVEAIEDAWKAGVEVKSCFLCRYYALARYRNDAGPIFCKFLKKQIKSTTAVECEYYKPDEKVLGNYERPQKHSFY